MAITRDKATELRDSIDQVKEGLGNLVDSLFGLEDEEIKGEERSELYDTFCADVTEVWPELAELQKLLKRHQFS